MTKILAAFYVTVVTIGLVVTMVNFRSAWRERRIVLKAGVDAGRTFALLDEIRRELLRVLTHVSLLLPGAAGLYVIIYGPPTPDVLRVISLSGLLLAPSCLALNSILDGLARRRLRRFYKAQ